MSEYDTTESRELISRFAVKHPELRDAIRTSVHAVAVAQNRALFYVPSSTLTEDKHYIRVHVHDLATGALIDVGSTSSSPNTLEERFFQLIAAYQLDSCPECIEQADLCTEHVPADRPELIQAPCPNCGYTDSREVWTYLREDNGSPVYQCHDCKNEHTFTPTEFERAEEY